MALSQFTYLERSAVPAETVKSASALLCRAFLSDPLFVQVQASESRRRRGLPTLFSAVVRDAARLGGLLLGADATLAWLPMSQVERGLVQQALAGYWVIPGRFGFRATARLHAHEAWCHHRMAMLAPKDAAYVFCVGVEPRSAGRGLGSTLMSEALVEIARRHRHCVLRTEQQKNVRFYEKLGFSCVEKAVVPSTGLPTWFFLRALESDSAL